MNNIFTNKKIYQMLGSQGPAQRKKVKTLGEKETRQDRRAGKDNLVPSYFGVGGDDPTKTKLQRDAKERTSDPDYKKPKAKVLKKGPNKTGEPTFTKKKKKSSGNSNLTKLEQLAKPVLGILAGNWHPKIKAANEKKSRQMHAKKNASSGGQGSKK
tara:strand:- start:80 stop:547 length:468 start_codon:yes stop_codon:yes gene_type:complete